MKKRTITASIREACAGLGYDATQTQATVRQAKRLAGTEKRALVSRLVGARKSSQEA